MEGPAVEQAEVHMEHDSEGHGPEELQEHSDISSV